MTWTWAVRDDFSECDATIPFAYFQVEISAKLLVNIIHSLWWKQEIRYCTEYLHENFEHHQLKAILIFVLKRYDFLADWLIWVFCIIIARIVAAWHFSRSIDWLINSLYFFLFPCNFLLLLFTDFSDSLPYSQPGFVALHLIFRTAGFITYLLCSLILSSFVTSFVIVVVFLSIDFWIVKVSRAIFFYGSVSDSTLGLCGLIFRTLREENSPAWGGGITSTKKAKASGFTSQEK